MPVKNNQIAKLTKLNDELENYFRNTIIPQLFVDADLILRKFTPSAMKQFKLSDADIGKSIADIEDNFRLPTIIENILEVITNKEIFEKELQTTDSKWYQMNIIPYVVKKTNRTNGVVITFVDITGRIKDMEDQLKLIREHETLLDTISHDLRLPLGNLKTSISFLTDNSYSNNEEYLSILDISERSIIKMQEVIEELTNIRKQKYEHKPVNEQLEFESLLQDVRLSLAHHITESGAVIKSKIDVPHLTFERSKLRSLLYNLLSNAIKYRSTDRTPEIFINVTKEKTYNVISVKDNGLGINAAMQEDIFSKYFQVEEGNKGSGIGLYLVKQIADKSGGQILVESEPGKGSEFKVYLKAQ